MHNSKVLKEKKGSLVVVYRPSKNVNVDPTNIFPVYFATVIFLERICVNISVL